MNMTQFSLGRQKINGRTIVVKLPQVGGALWGGARGKMPGSLEAMSGDAGSKCHPFSFPAHSSQGHRGHLPGAGRAVPREVVARASREDLLFRH